MSYPQRPESRLSDASTAYRSFGSSLAAGSWIPAEHCGHMGWLATQDRIKAHHNTLLAEYIDSRVSNDTDHMAVWKRLRTNLTHTKATNASTTRHESDVEVVTTFDPSQSDMIGKDPFSTRWRAGGKTPPWLIEHPARPNRGISLVKARLPTEEDERDMSQNTVDLWWRRFSTGPPITRC